MPWIRMRWSLMERVSRSITRAAPMISVDAAGAAIAIPVIARARVRQKRRLVMTTSSLDREGARPLGFDRRKLFSHSVQTCGVARISGEWRWAYGERTGCSCSRRCRVSRGRSAGVR